MERKTIERWVKGFLLFGFALYIFLCLFSYDAHDPSFAFSNIGSPINDTIINFGGKIGAILASFLFFFLGKTAFIIIFILLFFGVNAIWGDPTNFWIKTLSSVGLMLSVSIFWEIKNNYNFSGGLIGITLGPSLQVYFGENGIYLLLIVLGIGFLGLGYKIFINPFRIIFQNYGAIRQEKIPLPKQTETTTDTKRPIKKIRKPTLPPEKKEVHPAPIKEEVQEPPIKLPSPITKAKDYKLPPLSILKANAPVQQETKEDFDLYAQVIEETLLEFGIEGEVVQINTGPRVTMFEVQLAPGVAIQKVYKIQDNLAMNLKTTTIRVVAPLANKSTLGIEVPNREISTVYLREILTSREFQKNSSKLTIAIGKSIMGKPVINDLKNMPHILIAGATGSGKTVCLNSFIASILYKATPEEVKFIMIDPKMVELISYNGLPHLLCPVVVDVKKAVNTLKWLISEMERRYKIFSEVKARNIEKYNSIKRKEPMPYIVVVIDELADLMMIARKEIETRVIRLAQLSRAAGIHLILATQRPSVNVITGVIKANLPCRISFQVTSKFDSRTILDTIGAEKLLGRGDLLFIPPGSSLLTRIQGCLVSDEEIEVICNFIKSQKPPEYEMEIMEEQEKHKELDITTFDEKSSEEDELYQEARRIVLTTKKASISMLQRRLKIGFNKAARLVEQMDEEGLLGPYIEGKPREVLVSNNNGNQQTP
ncbi:DNA translocase FtsK [bacterium]|nr:DNA translocase FtsK [bacterium]